MTGILGTQASLFSDLSLIIEVVATLLFTIGYFYGKRKRTHCIIMGSAVVANIIFVISYMISRILRAEIPSPPEQFAALYRGVVIPHGILSVLVLIMGALQAVLAYKWRKKANSVIVLGEKRPVHRKLGLATLILWYISLLTGLTVYIILYVV